MTNDQLLNKLEAPKGRISVVLDTDTYNEVDDQFALAYAILSKDKIHLEAIYAAPFSNDRASTPEEGMDKSYKEIYHILSLMKCENEYPVYRGSTSYLSDPSIPIESEAVENLISRARQKRDEPLYVVAIGAITNIASAIIKAPDIMENIVVLWLGSNAYHYENNQEFNMIQDIIGAKVLFDSKVPLIHFPCQGVVSHLITSPNEVSRNLHETSDIGSYLAQILEAYSTGDPTWTKVIWDIATIAWLNHPEWLPSRIMSSPEVMEDGRFQLTHHRHPIRTIYFAHRDEIFRDLYSRLRN